MRKGWLLGAAALLLLTGGAGSAAAADLAVFGSYWNTDDLEDSLGGGLNLMLGDGPVRFDLRAAHFPDLTRDAQDIVDPGDDDFPGSLDVKATPLGVGVAFRPAVDYGVRPFFGGGANYYLLDTNRWELDDELGYYITAGLETGGDAVGFYAEAMYQGVEATVTVDPEDLDDIDDIDPSGEVDIDLAGFAANAGVVFRF
jgi:hypothetical protein